MSNQRSRLQAALTREVEALAIGKQNARRLGKVVQAHEGRENELKATLLSQSVDEQSGVSAERLTAAIEREARLMQDFTGDESGHGHKKFDENCRVRVPVDIDVTVHVECRRRRRGGTGTGTGTGTGRGMTGGGSGSGGRRRRHHRRRRRTGTGMGTGS